MGWAGYVAHKGRWEMRIKFRLESLNERDCWEYRGIDGRIILKINLRNIGLESVGWTGVDRHCTSDGCLGTRQWTFGFHKRRKVSWLSKRLLASQLGLCSMEQCIVHVHTQHTNECVRLTLLTKHSKCRVNCAHGLQPVPVQYIELMHGPLLPVHITAGVSDRKSDQTSIAAVTDSCREMHQAGLSSSNTEISDGRFGVT
jgi:hypothetical protein